MVGEVETIPIAPGVEQEITRFSPEENKDFDRDYERITSLYTKYSITPEGKHAIRDLFIRSKEAFRTLGEICKKTIQPSAGVFQGMRALSGFGFSMIKPWHITPKAQNSGGVTGRPTFDASVEGLNINEFYGLYHNGAIGAAYDSTPLYLRKELGIGIVGMLELSGNPIIEEVQFEINQKPLPVYNMLVQMRGTDLRLFEFPNVEVIKPAAQYRSQAKFSQAAGNTTLIPLGLAYPTAEYMRIAKCSDGNQPSTTAP